jgi:hypothetical protein
VLPCALVDEFAAAKSLVQLNVPGWPRAIGIDLLWNKRSPPALPEAGCGSICRMRADPCD